MLRIWVIWLVSMVATSALAQQVDVVADTVPALADSLVIKKGGKVITIESYAKRFQPRKALLYSAVLPGMGQVYNKKYWKLPLIYGGFYLLTKYAVAYNNLYIKYKEELYGTLEIPVIPPASGYTQTQLRTLIDNYRRQRDYFIVLDGFMYILQLIDAHVDAHLKEFDLNPQLKVSLKPTVQPTGLMGHASGFSLTLKF